LLFVLRKRDGSNNKGAINRRRDKKSLFGSKSNTGFRSATMSKFYSWLSWFLKDLINIKLIISFLFILAIAISMHNYLSKHHSMPYLHYFSDLSKMAPS
jgi:hypothetical protein